MRYIILQVHPLPVKLTHLFGRFFTNQFNFPRKRIKIEVSSSPVLYEVNTTKPDIKIQMSSAAAQQSLEVAVADPSFVQLRTWK